MSFSVGHADWERDGPALRAIRRAVFIEEQRVPEELEWDADDAAARHFLALVPARAAVGCARLLPSGQIGRVAVLPAWRRQGIGQALLRLALETAEREYLPEVFLHAQLGVVPLYARLGFSVCSEVFEEAGIPHCVMRRG